MSDHTTEKAQRTLALLLHDEFCLNPKCPGGVKDFMEAAGRLLPKIEQHVFRAAEETR